ncbi:MAG: histidinol-phosphate transaminase [Nitrospinae bacterium]|nr:histidinol-phosphate transaminase [Nitrospinota bacterium]
MVSNILSLVKKDVLELRPYQVENIPCRIKLDAMENPYPPPELLIKKIVEGIGRIKINRYPDPHASRLKTIISSQTGISVDNIIIGNGSDELIQIILTAFGEKGDKVLFPIPSFSMYEIIAKSLSLITKGVTLGENWELPLDKFIYEIERLQPKVIFIGYPNNPTGNCFSRESILKIIERASGIVVLDEAYYDFSKKTFLPPPKSPLSEGGEWGGKKNLIILRTLSKIGMAGLRVGYLIADKDICTELNKVRLPYNSNAVSQEIASIILENRIEIDRQIDAIISERERLMDNLKKMKGIQLFPSETNFILLKIVNSLFEKGDEVGFLTPIDIFYRLLDNGILIRNFGNDIYLKDFLRVTIGIPEENDEFLNTIQKSLVQEGENGKEGRD